MNQKYWMHSPKSLKLLAWKVKTKQNAAQVHALRGKANARLIRYPKGFWRLLHYLVLIQRQLNSS